MAVSHTTALALTLCLSACGRINFDALPVEAQGSDAGSQIPMLACPALPAATSPTIQVGPADSANLQAIVAGAAVNSTILFEDGVYSVAETIVVPAAGIVLRSKSGVAANVVLDGNFATRPLISVVATDVTIAEISLLRADDTAIQIDGPRSTVYGVVFLDVNGAAIRANSVANLADDATIACSTFRQSPALQNSGCTLQGINGRGVRGWKILANVFDEFRCEDSTQDRAVQLSSRSRDALIVGNVFRDSFISIQLGLNETSRGNDRIYLDDPACAQSAFVDFFEGTVCNNFIYRTGKFSSVDSGIALWQSCSVTVGHNTVVTPTGVDSVSAIEWRFSNTSEIEIVSNLVTGSLRIRDSAVANEHDNLQVTFPEQIFVDLDNTDLHLRAGQAAIDGAVMVPSCLDDIDLQPRDQSPDFGADEFAF